MRIVAGGIVLLLGLQLSAQANAPHVLLRVPFFPDKTDQCGPSTLAALLSFWGQPVQPQDLRTEMYEAKLKGTLPMDLVHTAKTHLLEVKMVSGTLQQLRDELNAGRPVLAMLNLGFDMMPVGHYVIITGYDEDKGGLFMHSGGKANRFVSYKKFEKQWRKADYWALLADKP